MNTLLLIDKIHSDKVAEYFIQRNHSIQIITKNSSPAHNNYASYVIGDKINLSSIHSPELIISYRFWAKIPESILKLASFNAFNYHPAPLPEYRGVKCATFSIINDDKYYGVTVHKITKDFDAGEILKENHFLIN